LGAGTSRGGQLGCLLAQFARLLGATAAQVVAVLALGADGHLTLLGLA
jgi:hypothetical protein